MANFFFGSVEITASTEKPCSLSNVNNHIIVYNTLSSDCVFLFLNYQSGFEILMLIGIVVGSQKLT